MNRQGIITQQKNFAMEIGILTQRRKDAKQRKNFNAKAQRRKAEEEF
jgi:hypothetical protein